ncbi:hypothetical protein [Castellaniella sp.]|uniref:hypothetical protein n=1 Tax=Castellaniella sp. TaxID=1955812 RepID=UPI002AFF6ED4|nr:hypothetical protein [Castellaniella sp.]
MNLHTLSLDEFLRLAHAQADSLTDAAIQIEALRRLQGCADQAEELEGFLAVIDEYEVTADDLRAVIESHPASLGEQIGLLAALNDQDIHSADQLRGVLNTLATFRSLANDAGDLFSRLTSLIETAQKED